MCAIIPSTPAYPPHVPRLHPYDTLCDNSPPLRHLCTPVYPHANNPAWPSLRYTLMFCVLKCLRGRWNPWSRSLADFSSIKKLLCLYTFLFCVPLLDPLHAPVLGCLSVALATRSSCGGGGHVARYFWTVCEIIVSITKNMFS